MAPQQDDGRTTGTSQRRQEQAPASVAVLAAAVVATLTPMVLLAVVVVATALWSAAGGAGAGPLGALGEAAVSIGLVGAITMVGVYAVGVPVALAVERLASGRTALRWVAYGLVGAAAGATVGAWIATPDPTVSVAALFGGFGLLAALAGGGAVGWFRGRPIALARRIGRRGTLALIVIAAASWSLTGAVLIPLVVATIAGGVSLLLVRLVQRDARDAA